MDVTGLDPHGIYTTYEHEGSVAVRLLFLNVVQLVQSLYRKGLYQWLPPLIW